MYMKECNCELILRLKPEYATLMKSTFMSKSVHLGKLDPKEYGSYVNLFPDAFTLEKDCKCEITVAKKQAIDYMRQLFKLN